MSGLRLVMAARGRKRGSYLGFGGAALRCVEAVSSAGRCINVLVEEDPESWEGAPCEFSGDPVTIL